MGNLRFRPLRVDDQVFSDLVPDLLNYGPYIVLNPSDGYNIVSSTWDYILILRTNLLGSGPTWQAVVGFDNL